MIIAIDGPAGAGKSTAARTVAQRHRLGYLDTGAMYRCVTLAARHADPAIAQSPAELVRLAEQAAIRFGPLVDGKQDVWLGDRDVTLAIREESLTDSIKKISQVPEVRVVLVQRQRDMGRALEKHHGGCVVEGRDIGTVVFPDAEAKFWLEADLAVRAQRRSKESGADASAVRQTMHLSRRDQADKNPALGSLVKAADALLVDTTDLSIDAVCKRIAGHAGLK